ncbi:MAG TPA: PIG-L family deacetylase [Bacillota bacterium]|nr:PIG-L family deacetylase [Bacillota bacterium]
MKMTVRLVIIIILIGVGYLGISYLFNGRNVIALNPAERGHNLYQKRVLVISPHQDDEIIGCAGIIKRFVDRGADIRIMYTTSGDMENKQKERIKESISALKLLGLPKEKIIYLGYGDWRLLGMYFSKDPDAPWPSEHHKQTISFPDLGLYSYHFAKYKSEAAYTRRNILDDLYNVLLDFQPDEIFMPAQMEGHQDHSGSAYLTIEAIKKIQQSNFYQPITYEYMLYSGDLASGLWLPPLQCNPAEPVTNTAMDIDNYLPYPWFRRVSFAAPPQMTAPFTPVWPGSDPIKPSDNIKYNAIHMFESQLTDDYWLYERYIRSNEVFWKRKIASLSYSASVQASAENFNKNQLCLNVIDGMTIGELKAPFDGWNNYFQNLEWSVDQATAGSWIQLNWEKPVSANQVKLYDRPNFNDNILAGSLGFSDGTTIKIGSLNPNGAATTVTFPLKTFSWVRLTIDSFEGNNPGLSEFEVYDTRENIAPVAIITASAQNPSQLAVKAVDRVVDGYPENPNKEWVAGTQKTRAGEQKVGAWIQLNWPQEYIVTSIVLHDRISPENQIVSGRIVFNDGSSLRVGELINDGTGVTIPISAKAVKSVRFEVIGFKGDAPGLAEIEVFGYPLQLRDDYYNITATARVTASSEDPELNRFMAVDGVRSGAPCDRGYEWVSSSNQSENPWIQFNWERTYHVKRVVLYDRPNLEDHVLAGRLYFSDGGILEVGSLPNDGAGYPVDIPNGKNIKSLRFEITKADGRNNGLAEVEIYGGPGE